MRCGIKQRSSSCVNLETSAESGYLCGTKQAAKSTYSSDRTVMQAACKTLATSTRQHLSHANYVCVSYCRQHLMASCLRDTEIDSGGAVGVFHWWRVQKTSAAEHRGRRDGHMSWCKGLRCNLSAYEMVKTRKLRVVRRDCRVLTQYGDRPAYRAANFEKIRGRPHTTWRTTLSEDK